MNDLPDTHPSYVWALQLRPDIEAHVRKLRIMQMLGRLTVGDYYSAYVHVVTTPTTVH